MRVPASSTVRRSGLVAGVAALALLAAACASNSSSTGSSSSSPSSSSSSSSSPSSSGSGAAGGSGGSSSASSAAPSGSTAATSSGSGAATASSSSSGGSSDPKTATSAADLGGMDALVAAANKEGALNVIALPPDWANYGEVIKAFQAKYPGIKVTSQQPDISSAQEIQAADANKGTDQAPDVFDLGAAVTLKSTASFAPYKVAAWADIPAEKKEASGLWVNDYTGVMSVGYNADKFGEITSLDQLTDAKFKGAVALNGNPTQANAALNGVVFAALAKGGSMDDISKGVEYFKSLKAAGTLSSVDPTPATVTSGQVGVLFDWSYKPARLRQQAQARGRELEDVHPVRGGRRRLLQPGDQQGRPAPRGGPAVGGVPLLRHRPESVDEGRRLPGALRRPEEGRNAGRRRRGQPAQDRRHRHPADRRPGHQGQRLPGGQLVEGSRQLTEHRPPPARTGRGARRVGPFLGTTPFLLYTGLFLLLPTAIIIVGAFQNEGGGFTLANIKAIDDPSTLDALRSSVILSLVTAVVGAVVGGVLAYVLTTGAPGGTLRRLVTAACSVLAQFGGALLAFAFIATVGTNGLITRALAASLGVVVDPNYLSTLSGFIPVYLYFQIPLMVIVFLPAVTGSGRSGGRPARRSAARRGRSGGMSAAPCCCRRSWVRYCYSSRTRSPRTPPQPPWSASTTR